MLDRDDQRCIFVRHGGPWPPTMSPGSDPPVRWPGQSHDQGLSVGPQADPASGRRRKIGHYEDHRGRSTRSLSVTEREIAAIVKDK
jgi:hypothetical protein